MKMKNPLDYYVGKKDVINILIRYLNLQKHFREIHSTIYLRMKLQI